MLQPLQLQGVSGKYANEIRELKDFFAKAGVPVGTGEALAAVARRLREDRSFHRDLALNLWVATHTREADISYADLLGMLALAAAGAQFAATADERDAHELLRFLMESRQPAPLEGTRSPAAVPPMVLPAAVPLAPQPLPPPQSPVANFVREPVALPSAEPAFHDAETPDHEDRRRAMWMSGVGVALAAVLLFLLFHHRPAPPNSGPTTASATQPAEGNAASNPPAGSVEGEAQPASSGIQTATPGAAPLAGQRQPTAAGAPRGAHFGPAERGASVLPSSRSESPSSAAATSGASDLKAAVATPPPGNAVASPAPAPTSPASGTRPASPAYPGSGSGPVATFGSPSAASGKAIVPPVIALRANPRGSDDMTDSRYPHLLRRHPAGPMQDYTVDYASSNAGTANSGNAASNPTPRGIVRQTSLGMMAGNVVYSPTPAYPPAASAAHVQGEVKIEAEVNRDGTVGSARVVSGPPLLRDAALNAVEQWRFRPFMSRGKPVPMGATAILDFELQ